VLRRLSWRRFGFGALTGSARHAAPPELRADPADAVPAGPREGTVMAGTPAIVHGMQVHARAAGAGGARRRNGSIIHSSPPPPKTEDNCHHLSLNVMFSWMILY
jgi:hypothetical protein